MIFGKKKKQKTHHVEENMHIAQCMCERERERERERNFRSTYLMHLATMFCICGVNMNDNLSFQLNNHKYCTLSVSVSL
jgi:hypothetical protein